MPLTQRTDAKGIGFASAVVVLWAAALTSFANAAVTQPAQPTACVPVVAEPKYLSDLFAACYRIKSVFVQPTDASKIVGVIVTLQKEDDGLVAVCTIALDDWKTLNQEMMKDPTICTLQQK
jgi:hypothetical protein